MCEEVARASRQLRRSFICRVPPGRTLTLVCPVPTCGIVRQRLLRVGGGRTHQPHPDAGRDVRNEQAGTKGWAEDY